MNLKSQEHSLSTSTQTAFVGGSKIYLRPLCREDLNECYLGWLNDPEVTRYMETGVFPTTMEELEKYYEEVTNSHQQVIFAVIDKKSGQHVGNVKLGPIHWVHRKATLGIMIGVKELWGTGIGTEATRLAVEYGFYRLNLQRVDLGVFADHESAVRCYKKIGFEVEGRFRDGLFQDGEYKDRLWMGLLRSDYARLNPEKDK
jgi:ribosomal-protein-alanine N-acetyltransferase